MLPGLVALLDLLERVRGLGGSRVWAEPVLVAAAVLALDLVVDRALTVGNYTRRVSAVAPAVLSPRRPVPASIPRPEYVDRPAPAPYDGPEVKDAETIERMRAAGRLAAQALREVGRRVAPGRGVRPGRA